MAKTDTLYAEALSLSANAADNFIELGRVLRTLREGDPEKFRDFVEKSGTKKRKAYYLINIVETFDALGIPASRLAKIGWTKVSLIQPVVNQYNVGKMLENAEKYSADNLKRILKGEDPIGDAHAILMHFSPENYSKLMDVLIQHGAEKTGRGGVDNKEDALMRLIETVKK